MDKRSIVLLVIAGIILISGPILKDVARQKQDKYGHYIGRTSRQTKIELKKADDMIRLSKFSVPVGTVLGTAGALWLIISAVQGGKKQD